jgi:NADH dehydrogenase
MAISGQRVFPRCRSSSPAPQFFTVFGQFASANGDEDVASRDAAQSSMKSSLFITGATGFVGRQLLERIETDQLAEVVCLTRQDPQSLSRAVRYVRGDLSDVASYRDALSAADTVVHLAASTGNASPSEHRRVNGLGTSVLVRECQRAGVRRFLYVSSIAAGFEDVRYYPYAQSKRIGEEAVRQSGLRHTIVRPTMVLGPGSPIGERLQALASKAVTPLIGSGRARVQPIHVTDLADALLFIIRSDRFSGEVLELGGPDVLTMEELLRQMHHASTGGHARIVRIPAAPLRFLLATLERMAVPLPVTAGQLASFVNDGVAEPNTLASNGHLELRHVRDMVNGRARV